LGDYRSTILDNLLRDAYGLSNIRSILPEAREHGGLLEANGEPLLLLGELKVWPEHMIPEHAQGGSVNLR